MNKYWVLFILLLVTSYAAGQKKKSIVHVIKSESDHHIQKNGVDISIIYKGVFQQESSIFSSDSAYLYEKENVLEGFGHVLITQGDTLNVFGDKLHYDGNTKIAIMTDNVRMIDRDATLTTNYLTYSTATKIGTYTGGGKLVNKDNTLTSKNGFYFSSTRDAYFRYNVVLNTVDAIIKTDTLRYNSGTRIAYFYGPTNIYGKKDNDTLYTENGTYNTETERAFFGKNNLWRQKTKTLKGDSLYYDRLIGYGKAIGHVTFTDSEQKIILKGELGENFKKTDVTLMTVHPYVVIVTVDTVRNDTTKLKTTKIEVPAKGKKTASATTKNTMPVLDTARLKSASKDVNNLMATALTMPGAAKLADSVKKIAGKADKQTIAAAMLVAGKLVDPTNKTPGQTGAKTIAVKKDSVHIRRDSLFATGDTIETWIMRYKDLKILQQERFMAGIRDTSIKYRPSIVYTKPVKYLDMMVYRFPSDTSIFHKNQFKNTVIRSAVKRKPPPPKNGRKVAPPAPISNPIDSVNLTQEIKLNDTAKVRVLTIAHHAKIFKSDLQARADSIFFSYSDSIARMYYHPMIWAQDSQLSGDTINLQLKHGQIDNIALFPSAFIVNIEKKDSIHFNQIGGRKMRGFFKKSKLQRMYVDGNAETIYYDRDSTKVTQMHRTITSRIRVNFVANQPMDVTWLVKPEARVIPLGLLKEDDKFIKGFLWKPKDRPISKESIIPTESYKPKTQAARFPIVKKGVIQSGLKKPGVNRTISPAMKLVSDSLKIKTDTIKHIGIKPKGDSVIAKRDTAKTKYNGRTAQ